MSDMTSSARGAKVLGIMALTDLLTGLVLSAVGIVSDIVVLAVAGVVLLLSGGGMLAFVAWRRNRPESL